MIRRTRPALASGCKLSLLLLCVLLLAARVTHAAISGEPVNCPASLQAEETLCDGLDNDCDGRTDELDPVAANECNTGLKGACAKGYYQCHPVTKARVCTGPKPMPETTNGIDDDCNGVVDDVPNVATAIVSRAALVRATGISASLTNTYEMALRQRGIDYDVLSTTAQFDNAFPNLRDRYGLVVIPGSANSNWLTAARRTQLESFVSAGGVIMIFNPDGGASFNALAGIGSITARADVSYLRIDPAAQAPILNQVDTVEELNLYLNGFVPDIKRDARVMNLGSATNLATFYTGASGDVSVGSGIARRKVGLGSVYTFGFDMYTYVSYTCYINCFDPSLDVLAMMLRDGLREGCQGHSVVKHTVPGFEDSILFMSTDTHDYSDTVTGMLHTVNEVTPRPRISFFVQTTTDDTDPQVIAEMCTLGQCPVGGHTVSHLETFNTVPLGTGKESLATGYTGTFDESPGDCTLYGEIKVNNEILLRATGSKMVMFRSPYLMLNPNEYPVLQELGIKASSSLAIGDLKANLPVDLSLYENLQGIFKHSNVYEFPLSSEDGLVIDGVRQDLAPQNINWFLGRWQYNVLQNRRNGGMTVVLDHDGWGEGPRNEGIISAKKQAMIAMFNFAKSQGIRYTMAMNEFTEWWISRIGVKVSSSFKSSTGYTGTLTGAAADTASFTLEFGDAIQSFSCAQCGAFSISGRRVVIDLLRAGVSASFTATVGGSSNPPQSSNTPQANPSTTPAKSTTNAPANPTPTGPPTNPPTCSGATRASVVVNSFSSASLFANDLGLDMSDDGSMAGFSISGGRASLTSKAGAYWYTLLAGATCFDATGLNGVSLKIRAPPGTTVNLELHTRNAACTTVDSRLTVALASYAQAQGGFSTSIDRTIVVPFSAFGNVVVSRLHAIVLSGITAGATVSIDDVTLTGCPTTPAPTTTAPARSVTPTPAQSVTPTPSSGNQCAALVVDSFTDAVISTNNLGFATSDDGTAASMSQTGGRLALGLKAGTYWYSLLANANQCNDLSRFSGFSFSVQAPAGSSFTLQLQYRSASCTGWAGSSNVQISGLTGAVQTMTVSFSQFSPAVPANRLFAVSLFGFTGASSVSIDNLSFVC
ncbi:hypothetical protein CAOG_07779 [Capsaspora owczarzaki ATCC 30864]|uniref:NodB homology domain-containing protein n=1 Tax=Capsaspora owczarzaki (strain ATCC 30864) TaxID=595528 RepID=A0A0D2W0F6_CAPO3|nr:hypothetical protein CAOG_07779 [Capsaspora owczarzaki ATCC 30864]KJE97672.1 hypothetical protein CAOG_007779 [Capsaspora owczarzaki ATCC 30864]|eukprot:XP_004342852.1 hypothetical protein CAOG_07779 [Capsaspora owczarzaki ATCC 30864]